MPPTVTDGEFEGFRDYLRAALVEVDHDRPPGSDRSVRSDSGKPAPCPPRSGRVPRPFGGRESLLAEADPRQPAKRQVPRVKKPRIIPYADLDRSSVNIEQLCAAAQSSPSGGLRREARAVLIARLLARLPPDQAEAVVLKHCEGWPVEAIGRHMNRSPQAIGGLLKRGLRALRELIVTQE